MQSVDTVNRVECAPAPFRCLGSLLLSACLVTAICTGAAVAQSPVAYVYVAQTSQQDGTSFPSEPIYAFSVDSAGKVTPLNGSPFTQVTGLMVGTNGSQFITNGQAPGDMGGPSYLNYLYSYDVASNGVIGQQVSEIDMLSGIGSDCGQEFNVPDGAELDHTGKYIYVPFCDSALQTYKISSSGILNFQNATTYSDPDQGPFILPKLTGNSAFAYTGGPGGIPPNATADSGFDAFARESDGSLEWIGAPTVTGPEGPADYYYSYYDSYSYNNEIVYEPTNSLITDDPINHLAVMLEVGKFTPPDTNSNVGCALASFTVGSQGDLTSTNTYDDMPHVCAQALMLSPSGKVLVAVATGGQSLQFFHFNGAEPITPLAEVVGKSGWFTNIAWDSSNHLYALNGLSGRLHVYTVSSSGVEEAPGSPYDLPFCGYDSQDQTENCYQNLIVRSIP
jgi:hypothetical protein